MPLELTGTVVEFTTPKINKAGDKEYASRSIVLEFGEEYVRNAAFEYDPDRKEYEKECSIGDVVKISFSLQSNKSKSGASEGAYFTKVTPYRLSVLESKNPKVPQPQAQAPAQQVSPPAVAITPASQASAPSEKPAMSPNTSFDIATGEDDLPF